MKAILALVIGLILSTQTAYAAPQWIDQIIHDRADYWGQSYYVMESISDCESDHFDPAVLNGLRFGLDGEHGIIQLLPGQHGMLPVFYRLGYTNEYDVWQAEDFLGWALAHGLRYMWHC